MPNLPRPIVPGSCLIVELPEPLRAKLAALGVEEAQSIVSALEWSSRQGLSDVAGILAELLDPSTSTRALFLAADAGHLDCVKALLPTSSPADIFAARRAAVLQRNKACLALLLAPPNDGEVEHMLLRIAASNDSHACCALLLPRSSPALAFPGTLDCAAELGFHRIADLVLQKLSELPVEQSQAALSEARARGLRSATALISTLVDRLVEQGAIADAAPPPASKLPHPPRL